MSWQRFSRVFATALCVGVASSLPLSAQLIEVDPAPRAGGTISDRAIPSTAARGAVPEDRGRAAAPEPAVTPAETDLRMAPLRPASRRVESLTEPRLTGEVTSESFVLVLPQDPGATDLRIAHRSSIDVLAEQSGLVVFVNGREAGTLVPDNFSGFQEDSLGLEAGMLRAGQNVVEIVARHTHRVACGPDASFALWTEVAAVQSGVALSSADFGTDAIGFVSALAAQVAQGASIPLRRADPQQPLGNAGPLLAELSALFGGPPPGIVTRPHWTVAGDDAPMARLTVVPREAGLMAPRVARSGDGALVLLVEEGTDWSDLRQILATAFEAPDEDAIPALVPGRPITFGALEQGRLTAEGRYDVLTVPFSLPPDWLMLTSARARLDLDYTFAVGLPEGALLLVKANGTTIQMLPLDEEVEQPLPTLMVDFPARLLAPGANRIDFEVLVPGDPVDRACPALSQPVLSVSPESRLTVPATPRMSVPSLDLALARLSIDRVEATARVANTFDPATVPQIAAALAPGGQESVDPHRNASLVIATPADLELIETGALRGTREALTETLSRQRFLDAERLAAAAGTAWDAVTGDSPDAPSAAAGLTGLAAPLMADLRRLTLGAAEPAETWLNERSSSVALLQPNVDRPDEIWLVLGPQADPAEIARLLAASRDAPDGPKGQLAVYSDTAGWENWTSPDRHLDLHEGITYKNIRAILGTYATLEPLVFIGATLALTALSMLAALGFLVATRGRS